MMNKVEETTSSAWDGFKKGQWQTELDIRDFIEKNFVQYDGDESFLQGPTKATTKLNDELTDLKMKQRKVGVLDADTKVVSTITSHAPGYLDKDLEKIVGLQTDKPLKRSLLRQGGIRMAQDALETSGYKLDPEVE